jgi:hypothetical protein
MITGEAVLDSIRSLYEEHKINISDYNERISFNTLKSRGNYVLPVLTISNSACCIYVFGMIISVNGYYFLKQH